jgi:DNA invertase Pin-like site-specific DNA recombinase
MENITATTGIAGQRQVEVKIKIKYCLYSRKSSEEEERQQLSIESQVKEMLFLAEKENLEIVTIKRESHSAKEAGQRPVFNEIIEDIKQGKFNGILTWDSSRISRNAGDLGRVVDLMDQKLLVEIKTYSQTFSNNPNEKFLLMILGSQAKLENDHRSINVKRGLRARVEMGLWVGMAPVGYLNQKRLDKRCEIIVDPDRAPIVRQCYEKVAYEQWSGIKLFHWLRLELNFKTVGNHNLTLSGIYRTLSNTIYYGVFEYPRKSGNWYQGKFEPLISKELFDKVQAQLKRDNIQRQSREFAFTKLMKCGLCGSGISAEEKYKQLKVGTIQKYIYYGCTRARDRNCKNNYLREDELIKQLLKIINKLDLDDIVVQYKFENELKRFNKFQKNILDAKGGTQHLDVDKKAYAKYLLLEGSNEEKRELMGSFRSKIELKQGVVSII